MVLPVPPNEAIVRAALIDLISSSTYVLEWLGGDNPKEQVFNLDIGEYNMFEVPQEELSIRVQMLSIIPGDPDQFARCLDFFCRVSIWLFFYSAGSSLAHSYMGAVERALQGTSVYTKVFQGETVALRDIIFAGRVTQVPSAQKWAIPSTFTFRCEYIS